MEKIEITNDFDAVVAGLVLAITAPTNEDAEKVLDLISGSLTKLTKKQIEKAKKLSLLKASQQERGQDNDI